MLSSLWRRSSLMQVLHRVYFERFSLALLASRAQIAPSSLSVKPCAPQATSCTVVLVRALVTAKGMLLMQVRSICLMLPTDQPLPTVPAHLLALTALIHSHFRNPGGGMDRSDAPSSADAAPRPSAAVAAPRATVLTGTGWPCGTRGPARDCAISLTISVGRRTTPSRPAATVRS